MMYRWFIVLFFVSIALEAYVPVDMPNGNILPWTMEDGCKTFHLTAETVKQEFAPGLIVNCWGYNGKTPGPVIEAVEGDRVRIYVTNKLPEPTTVHWHGVLLPNSMDGVSGLTQSGIPPGETFRYEFPLRQNGTCMYHPHIDEVTQIGMGLVGFLIIHPKDSKAPKVDRDFAIMLQEWFIPPGASTPDPLVMTEFNYFTFNGRVYPGTAPLVVRKGQRARIRFGNLSMDNHPIHLHGHLFAITGTGAGRIPPSAQYTDVTVDVPVGATRDIEFIAREPGDWAMHCHKTHHVMNGMAHGVPNMLGVDQRAIAQKMRQFIPGFMPMGEKGMEEMTLMQHMTRPANTLPYGYPGPFGMMDMGGMFTIVKVREGITSYEDPGWYKHEN